MNIDYTQLANEIILDQRSKDLRLLVLEALEGGSRGHLGPALSLIEIVRVLYDSVLYHDSSNPFLAQRDRFILSKGHGCLGLYAVLADHGYISKSDLKGYCSFQSNLGGHPERLTLPGIEFSTGSLGHGLSVGIGMAVASRLKGENWRTFILIGDGELGEGSNWEAAMHASQHRLGSLTVIIDFNQMQAYGQINSVLTLDPLAAKFEAFGFDVVNVNGHDINQLEKELNSPIVAYGKPKAIIAYTVKGKGIPSAENSTIWHHRAKITSKEIAPLRISYKMRKEALSTVYELAKQDPRIVFIGSDLGAGTLNEMKEELPQQFFMEGISEQHIVGFAAGLAQEGFIPYINTIGTFLTRRSFEQVSIDIGLHNLPVRLLASGGGMVYAPLGPTHTAIDDFALMLNVPNMKVLAPADALEMENLLRTLVDDASPHYIRFGKGDEDIVTNGFLRFQLTPKVFGGDNSEVIIFTTGIMLQNCLNARDILIKKAITVTVIHCPYLNDLSLKELLPIMELASIVVCIEEHVPRGGLFTQLLHEYVKLNVSKSNLYQRSLPASFSHNYGSQGNHFEVNGLTGPQIAMYLVSLLEIK